MTEHSHPVSIRVAPEMKERNRLTTAFRALLAIPHILLVGGPFAAGAWFGWQSDGGLSWGTGVGVLGAVAGVASMIAWFALVLTGGHPRGLWGLAAFYLRWRVRVLAYLMLVRDEYPPFGEENYPAEVLLPAPPESRDRVTVFFRILLAVPHLIVIGLLSVAWALTTTVAWVMILVTGRMPETIYGFALGMLAWTARLDAYLLLLHDEYPPFTLRV